MRNVYNYFRIILIFSIIVRELLAPWTGHPWDFELFVRLGPYVLQGNNPYSIIPYSPNVSFWYYNQENMTSIAYPPLYAYYSAFSYFVYQSLDVHFKYLYYFILKQPLIASDVMLGYLIFKYYKNKSNFKQALFLSSAWLLNPYTILFSSMWGLPHTLAILFLFLAFTNFKKIKSLFYLSMSFLISGLPFIFFFPFLTNFLYKKNISKKLILTIAASITFIFFIVLIPFIFLNWDISNLRDAVDSVLFKESYGRFSYWFFVYYLNEIFPGKFIWLYYIANYIAPYVWLPLTILTPIFWYSFSKINEELKNFLACNLATVIVFLLTRNSVNEQYLLYLFIIFILFYEFSNIESKRIVYYIFINVWVFILLNNVLLLRFFTPINPDFYFWDIEITTSYPFMIIRETFILILSIINAILLYKLIYSFMNCLEFKLKIRLNKLKLI